MIASERDAEGNDVPLEGVTIRVEGFPELNAVTDANGDFILTDVPAPEFFVAIDGLTTTRQGGEPVPVNGYYPNVGKPFHSRPGETVQLEMDGEPFDIHLPFILDAAIHEILPGQEMTLAVPDAQIAEDAGLALVALTLPADSLIGDDGTPGTEVGIYSVDSDRLPAPLPAGLVHSIDITVQADVTNFDIPAPITFPNVDNLPPGATAAIYSFNHDQGIWDIIGLGTVSADGLVIKSNPGVGILAPGWHGVGPNPDEPPPPDDEEPDPDCNQGDLSKCIRRCGEDALRSIGYCTAAAAVGIAACAFTTAGFPVCAGAVLAAQALCEAAAIHTQIVCNRRCREDHCSGGNSTVFASAGDVPAPT